jgi:hypothetical protein
VDGQAPLRYATSFFGIIDLLAILPTLLSLLFPAGTRWPWSASCACCGSSAC